jgi:hypothetical protein
MWPPEHPRIRRRYFKVHLCGEKTNTMQCYAYTLALAGAARPRVLWHTPPRGHKGRPDITESAESAAGLLLLHCASGRA